MHIEDLEYFRDRLIERQQNLSEWLNSADPTQGNDGDKVRQVLGQIKDALERIEDNSFGKCAVCHDDIELNRLESRPEIEVCLDCLSDTEKRSIEDDLRMAGRMQSALLPAAIPNIDGFEVTAKMLPASSVGGDYYDFLPGDGDGRLWRVIVADAMGHGVSAGLLMSNLQGVLKVLSQEIFSPGELVFRLNRWLCRNVPITKFISLVCLCLEKTGTQETLVTYANAGHCPPVLLRNDGSVERLESTGGVLGVHEQFSYEENTKLLSSGDVLLLYTDGITDTENPQGNVFGEDGLIDFIRNHRQGGTGNILDALIDEISRFSGSIGRNDDQTLISLLKL